MKAQRLLIASLVFSLSCPAQAKEVDPATLADGSVSTKATGPGYSNTWDRLKSQVTDWWSSKKTKTVAKPMTISQPTNTAATPAPTATQTAPEVTAAPTPTESTQATAPAPESTAVPAQVLSKDLPEVDHNEAINATGEKLQEAKAAAQKGNLSVSKPGRKPGVGLGVNSTGVPVFPLVSVKQVRGKNGKITTIRTPVTRIPALDVGEEPTVSRSDFILPDFRFDGKALAQPKPLKSPSLFSQGEVSRVTNKLTETAGGPRQLPNNMILVAKPVTKESVASIQWTVNEAPAIDKKPFKEFSQDELEMIAALVIMKKTERCFFALGLFERLKKNKALAVEADFQLGVCAASMKLYSAAFDSLARTIKSESKDFAGVAIGALARDLPQQYEVEFARLIRGLKTEGLIFESDKDAVAYLTAKGSYKEGLFPVAKKWAAKVSKQSTNYGNAQYVMATSEYNDGNRRKAIAKMRELRQWMVTAKVTDKNLNSLTAINLGRMLFAENRYQEALDMYIAIDRDHPVWVQGLVEQGWLQLAMEDFSGAIGNMYSLHSPYFKSVYKPESFAVRTIGYLNICQYGDAYKSLSWLEDEYRPWSEKLTAYISKGKDEEGYFETVKNYIRGKSDQDVDGVPHPVLREAARQRDYLNVQTSMNGKEDEVVRYDGVNEQIKAEKAKIRFRLGQATTRYTTLRAQVEKALRERQHLDQVEAWKHQALMDYELAIGLRFQLQMLEISRQGYGNFRTNSLMMVASEKGQLKNQAGKLIRKHLTRLQTDMNLMLGNNEFLRYEVFSGSGENIRYQVAGGEVGPNNRVPANVKPQKQMNWTFDGEYWADEIGKYRSSLKNNCGTTVGQMDGYFKNKASDGGQAAMKEGE